MSDRNDETVCKNKKIKKISLLQQAKLPKARRCGLQREVAEFKTFSAPYRKSLFLNITLIPYKAKPRE